MVICGLSVNLIWDISVIILLPWVVGTHKALLMSAHLQSFNAEKQVDTRPLNSDIMTKQMLQKGLHQLNACSGYLNFNLASYMLQVIKNLQVYETVLEL